MSKIQLVWLAMWMAATSPALAGWSISATTSPLTGVTTTTLETSANYGRFRIYCSTAGERGYYLATDYITGDGDVSYRVGTNPIVSESWTESSSNGYQVLFPPTFDLKLVQRLYQNWDFVFQYNSFVNGSPIIEMNSSGLPEAIDATRVACNWPVDVLPPGNGWGAALPTAAPADSKEATYVPGAPNQFRLIAWRDTNAQGKLQLLARLGDVNGPCSGPFVISDHRLYVTQNGKFVSAVSGKDFQASCPHSPTIVALNGDFDASGPFTLTSYPFHYHTTAPGNPMATVSFAQYIGPPPVAAIEYYYDVWNFYFMTSFAAEIAALDGGAFGGAWKRTGQTFHVWPSASNSFAVPTCRFFSTAFAPKSSHFYTPVVSECAFVQTDPALHSAWQYEAIAFYIQLTEANGLCPAGTIPLYRLYNNGVGGAPNHRYTTSLVVFNQMAAAGWQFEGDGNTKVFACVPE